MTTLMTGLTGPKSRPLRKPSAEHPRQRRHGRHHDERQRRAAEGDEDGRAPLEPVTDEAVEQRPHDHPRAHRGEQEAEGLRAALGLEEHRQDHALDGQPERDNDEVDQSQGAQGAGVPHEAQALDRLGPEPFARLEIRRCGGSRRPDEDHRHAGREERGRGGPQGRLGADEGDEQPADARARRGRPC